MAATEQVNQFETDGVTLLRSMLSPAEVQVLRVAVERRGTRRAAEGRRSAFWNESELVNDSTTVAAILLGGPVPGAVADILGTAALWLYEDTAIVKEPGAGDPTPWHQDLVHYPMAGVQVATAWIALDDVTRETGAVQYVIGSNRWQFRTSAVVFSTGEVLNDGGVPPASLAESCQWHSFDTAPGDVIVHHGLTLHGAPGNGSTRRRRAVAASYFGEDVVFEDVRFPWRHAEAEALRAGRVVLSDVYPQAWPGTSR